MPAASNPWLPFARWAVLQPEQHVFTTKIGGKVVPLPSFGIAAPSVNAALSALKGYGDTLQVKLTGRAAPRRDQPPPERHLRRRDRRRQVRLLLVLDARQRQGHRGRPVPERNGRRAA